MKSKLMISFFVIKVLTALSFPLFLIFSYDITKSALFIGLTSFLLSLGNITGNIYWHKLSRKTNVFFFSYISFASLLLLLSKNVWLTLFSSYSFSFFNTSAYISLLTSKSMRKNTRKKLSKLEEWGGWGYLLGLLLGVFVKFVPIKYVIYSIQFVSVFSLILIYKTIRRELKREISSSTTAFSSTFHYFYFYFYSLVKSATMLSGWFFKLSKPKEIKFHLPFILFFLSAGLIIPQLVTVIKNGNLGDYFVYVAYFTGSSLAIIGYKLARKVRSINFSAHLSLSIRILLFLLFPVFFILHNLELAVAVILFKIVQGLTWGILLIWFNYLLLRKKKSEIGTNLSMRSLSSSIGNLLGGWLFEFNVVVLSVLSASLILLDILFIRKKQLKFNHFLIGFNKLKEH